MAGSAGTEKFGHSRVDGYGFERKEDFDEAAYEEFMSTYFMVLARRAARWRPVVVGKDRVAKSRKLKRFCRKGIPAEYRPLVWMEVSGAGERMKDDPGLFRQLITQKLDDAVTESIMLDINRTFPENIYFVNSKDPTSLQKPLIHVLKAFAINNPHIGYCQGLNFVAGLMLLILRSEEKAFWLLDTVTKQLVPDYHASDMLAIKAEQELLGDVVQWKMPDLHAHLDQIGLHWSLVGMKWFICLYADVLPVETVMRIWDSLFYEGNKVLMRAALTLIAKKKAELMAAKDFTTAVEILKRLESDSVALNCHSFMESIFKDTGSMPRARLQRMRETCMRRVVSSS